MKNLYLLLFVFLIFSCSKKLKTYDFPDPVDTTTRPIEYQTKKTYEIGDLQITNDFPAARLNDFTQLNDSTYRATISPENFPINASPWYAFKIWSKIPQTIYLQLYYTKHRHRYDPKVSMDGENWNLLDSNLVVLAEDSINAKLKLTLTNEPLWVAAQEIQDSRRVGEWVNVMSKKPNVTLGTAGKSAQGRDLLYFNIAKGKIKKKPTVIIISRQHPPEVTGYFAMQSFVERIIDEGGKNGFLEKYRVMVYPLVNPDGVDLGHFRHNTGGIDLNRDWAKYNQPEIDQIVNHMVAETRKHKNKVLLGLDFHSTQEDVYYTFDESVKRKIPTFTKTWLQQIETELGLDDINNQPSPLNQPISKGWFFKQFGAESVTYEIGDETPRDFIVKKGTVSADAMMEILMSY